MGGMGGMDQEQLMAMLAQGGGGMGGMGGMGALPGMGMGNGIGNGAMGGAGPMALSGGHGHAHSGGAHSPEEEAMYEQLLGRLLQSVNMALAQRNPAAALEHCTKALRLCDEAWGPKSLHRALVLVPLARAHESTNATLEATNALEEAAEILQAHPDELPIENLAHVCDKLVSLLTAADKFVESERWALLAVQTRQEEMLQDVQTLTLTSIVVPCPSHSLSPKPNPNPSLVPPSSQRSTVLPVRVSVLSSQG